jgi:hypothetical protein
VWEAWDCFKIFIFSGGNILKNFFFCLNPHLGGPKVDQICALGGCICGPILVGIKPPVPEIYECLDIFGQNNKFEKRVKMGVR